MDTATLSALINGVFSVAVCFIGIYLGKSTEVKSPNEVKIYTELLNELYSPLHFLLVKKLNIEPHLDKVYRTHPQFFSPKLEEYYLSKSFDKIEALAESDYNWLKKNTGLPYSQKKILFIKKNSFNILQVEITKTALFSLLAFSVIFAQFFIISFIIQKIEWPKIFAVSIIIAGLLTVYYLVTIYIRNKKK